jgi:AcrR family transcriptional regulator
MTEVRRTRVGPARGRNADLTRSEIVKAAARHFALRGYTYVTLQDIANDADVTPALINRYFGSKRALFEVVASSEFGQDPTWPDSATDIARRMIEFWSDEQGRAPALALVRSIDIDDGRMLDAEIERRVRAPLRNKYRRRADVEQIVRLLTSLTMGLGLFGVHALLGHDDEPGLSERELTLLHQKLAEMIDACLDRPQQGRRQ